MRSIRVPSLTEIVHNSATHRGRCRIATFLDRGPGIRKNVASNQIRHPQAAAWTKGTSYQGLEKNLKMWNACPLRLVKRPSPFTKPTASNYVSVALKNCAESI